MSSRKPSPSCPARRIARLAAAWCLLAVGSPVQALGAPAFLAEAMPPAACLSAPDPACLLSAVDATVSRFERPGAGTGTAALRLFIAVEGGLDVPAADALLLRYDPKLTPDRLAGMRARSARSGRPPAAPAPNPPARSELGAERARIVAMPDRHDRVWRANDTIGALAAAGRIGEAEDLLAAVRKSLKGADAGLRDHLATTSARAFGSAGAWPAWSRALDAAGFDRKMAGARVTSDPEDDPTEFVVEEPLRQGIPLDLLAPWVSRAKDRAFRDSLRALIADAAVERGRAASWRADFGGFRRLLVETTARGEVLRRNPDSSFSRTDETALTFARAEATSRDDRGMALAVALQANLAPPSENRASTRDAARERVLETLIRALPSTVPPR